jgi:motility quorum-sensing regulator/GCU-specific mRNA interferase toxin
VAEKRKPTYDLDAFKAAFCTVGKLHVTGTALKGAAALGFGRAEIVAAIQTIQRSHFYKSMTSYADYRVWQDVYHVHRWCAVRQVYRGCCDRVFVAVLEGERQ